MKKWRNGEGSGWEFNLFLLKTRFFTVIGFNTMSCVIIQIRGRTFQMLLALS